MTPAGGLGVALLAWAFVHLGGEMSQGDTRALDGLVLHAMQSLRTGHPWASEVMRDLSGLGSTVVMVLCTTVTVGYLALVRARRMAGLVAIAVSLGAGGISLLKASFARMRPDPAHADLVATGLSFPSGHAGMSAIVFMTLGALLARTRHRAVERAYILVVAALLTALVGLSRVALGVHWASDVLAGWAFGLAWALVWLMLARAAVADSVPGADQEGVCQPRRRGMPPKEDGRHRA